MDDLQKSIIENYIDSYNRFDVDGMIKDFHKDIVFQNVSNGVVNLTTTGIEAFKTQAESAKAYFTERQQSIKSWDFNDKSVAVTIDYTAVLAIDFPNGMKAGETLQMEGRSEFEFENGQILKIVDIS